VFSWSVPDASVVGATTVLPMLAFDLLASNGSAPSGRFGVFLLVAEDLGEEEAEDDDGTLLEC